MQFFNIIFYNLFLQYPVEDVGRQTFYFWDALRASIYADQLEQIQDKDEQMGKTTQIESLARVKNRQKFKSPLALL